MLIVGFVMRTYKLDAKEFWHDESFTALVLSGRTTGELKAEICNTAVPFGVLQKYRTVTPNSSISTILKVIGEDEPGHAPLFYFLEYAFCSVFGATPYSMRLLCAIISTCTLPLVFWVARQVYKSVVLALLTTAFATFSPLLIYYAQEARDYSLGILFMLLTTGIFLTALKRNTTRLWIAYAISVIAGLYSWLFITVVVAAHVIFFGLNWSENKNKTKWLAASLAAATLTFIPWLAFVSQHMDNFKRAYDWIQPSLSLSQLVTVWLATPYKSVALFGFKTEKLATLLLAITVMQVVAIFLAAKPFKNNKYIFMCIIAAWAAIFAGQDVVFGGARSAVFRYQIPILVCALMLLPTLIEKVWRNTWINKSIAAFLICVICGTELLSDSYMLNTKIWPDKAIDMRFTLPLADQLNKSEHATLLAETEKINPTELIDLSYLVNPDTRLFLKDKQQTLGTQAKGNLYLWNGSESLKTQLSGNYDVVENVGGFPYITEAVAKRHQ